MCAGSIGDRRTACAPTEGKGTMDKTKKKRYRAAVMAFLIALTVCACGTGTREEEESTPYETSVQQTYEVEITESQEGAF